jgi:DNA replication protein DnaC
MTSSEEHPLMNKREDMRAPCETDSLQSRVRRLGLHGLLANWTELVNEPWIERVCEIEERERGRRSLERRLRHARIGAFKSMADFEWAWPKKVNRDAIEDLLSLGFVEEGVNAVFLGPNGVGKTMLLKNIAHRALLRGHTVRFTTASDMLSDLAAQESTAALRRRLGRYCQQRLLCIDEVGYLSYDARYADLLFEVVTRRYEEHRAIVLTTNKPFGEWTQVFPNAACVVTLVDRLLHRAELIDIDGESYRLKEAKERAASKSKARGQKRAA